MVSICPIDVQKIKQNSFTPKLERQPALQFDKGKTETPWKQTLSDTTSIKDKAQEILLRAPQTLDHSIWNDREKLMQFYADEIEMHLDQRVALFFHQAIVCYKMPFHFFGDGAEDQYGSAPTLKLKNGRTTDEHSYQAAHSSTLPCVYACSRVEWEIYQQQLIHNPQAPEPERFVYLKNATGYKRHNSTISLPTAVNQTDSLVDGSGGLRFKTMTLINQLAQSILNPIQATRQFVDEFGLILTQKIAQTHQDDKRYPILLKYQEYIRGVQVDLADALPFDRWMGVTIPDDERNERIRNIVYPRRYQVILASELSESKIAKSFQAACDQMGLHTQNECDQIKAVIISNTHGREKLILEKLFCKSAAALEQGYWENLNTEHCRKPNYTRFLNEVAKIRSKFPQHQAIINGFMRDLREECLDLVRMEDRFRADLFKALRRESSGLNQKEFADKFKESYPHEAMSASMVCRLEQPCRPPKAVYKTPENQRKKTMSVEKAIKCAQILNIEHSMFFPAIFSSEQ